MAAYKENEHTSTILVDPQVWNRVKIKKDNLIVDKLPMFNRIASSSKREKEAIVSRYEKDSDQSALQHKDNTGMFGGLTFGGLKKGVKTLASHIPGSHHIPDLLKWSEPKEREQHFPKVKGDINNILIETNLLTYISICHQKDNDVEYLKKCCIEEPLGPKGYFTELQLKHQVSNKEREQVLQIVEKFENITKRGEIPVTGHIERYTTRMQTEILLHEKAHIWTVQKDKECVLCFITLVGTYDNVKRELKIRCVDNEKMTIGSREKSGAPGTNRLIPQTFSNANIETPIY